MPFPQLFAYNLQAVKLGTLTPRCAACAALRRPRCCSETVQQEH